MVTSKLKHKSFFLQTFTVSSITVNHFKAQLALTLFSIHTSFIFFSVAWFSSALWSCEWHILFNNKWGKVMWSNYWVSIAPLLSTYTLTLTNTNGERKQMLITSGGVICKQMSFNGAWCLQFNIYVCRKRFKTIKPWKCVLWKCILCKVQMIKKTRIKRNKCEEVKRNS